jgi:pimeloyl-ACP methyl ester carboxylesterase
VNFESKSRLHRVKCPSLIIHAALDYVTSPAYTVPIERAIPGAVGITYDDVAHVVAGKDQKMRFCNDLFAFLARH